MMSGWDIYSIICHPPLESVSAAIYVKLLLWPEDKEVRIRALICFYLIQGEHLRISLCIPYQG